MVNRPGVAGAVLQSPPSLIDTLNIMYTISNFLHFPARNKMYVVKPRGGGGQWVGSGY